MDSSAFWGITSIAVTLLLSAIGIYFNITAKKERVKKTHENMLDILFSLFVNEKRVPTIEEITKLGKLKCRENKIKLSALPDEEEYLDLIYAKTLESKIIQPNIRRTLLNLFKRRTGIVEDKLRIENDFKKERLQQDKELVEESGAVKKIIILSGLLSTLLVVFMFVIVSFEKISHATINKEIFAPIVIMILFVTLTVLTLIILLRFKQRVIDTSFLKQSTGRFSISWKTKNEEEKLQKIAKDNNLTFHKNYSCSEKENIVFFFDYCLESKKKKYLIEISDFNRLVGMGSTVYKSLLTTLVKTAKGDKNNVTILLIKNANKDWIDRIDRNITEDWNIITTTDEIKSLKNFLK